MHQVRRQIETLVIEGNARHRHRKIGTAMITIGSGNNFFLAGLAKAIEIKMNDAYRRIIGHRSASTQKNMV